METTCKKPSALDELVRQVPNIDPNVLAEARQAAELLRKLGLLSTEPVEAVRPFNRQLGEATEPKPPNNWAKLTGIQFTKPR
jgi:hypothetical protein